VTGRERAEYLAAMVASGAADAEERRELEASPEAQQELASMEDAVAELALAETHAPPAGGLESLRRAVEGGASPQGDEVAAGVISLSDRRKVRLLSAVSVTSLAAAAAFALLWQTGRQELNRARDDASRQASELEASAGQARRLAAALRQDLTDTKRELDVARERLGLVRGAEVRLATLNTDAGSKAKIFMDPEAQRWLVYAHQLPDPGPNRDYQLWFVPKGGPAPIPAGLLAPRDGVLEVQVQVPAGTPEIGQAAISLEPKGGSKSPTDVQMIGPI